MHFSTAKRNFSIIHVGRIEADGQEKMRTALRHSETQLSWGVGEGARERLGEGPSKEAAIGLGLAEGDALLPE